MKLSACDLAYTKRDSKATARFNGLGTSKRLSNPHQTANINYGKDTFQVSTGLVPLQKDVFTRNQTISKELSIVSEMREIIAKTLIGTILMTST